MVEEERMLEDWSDVMDVAATVRNTKANAGDSVQSRVTKAPLGPATPQTYFTSPSHRSNGRIS